MVGVGRPDEGAMDVMAGVVWDLIANVGGAGAGASAAGEPADEGVDTDGDAIVAR